MSNTEAQIWHWIKRRTKWLWE